MLRVASAPHGADLGGYCEGISSDSLSGRASCQKQDFLLRAHAGLTARTLENLAVQKKLYAGEITQAEYFEWKIMWPEI